MEFQALISHLVTLLILEIEQLGVVVTL